MPTRLALIIPTTDRPGDLAACLAAIEREADDRLREIVVVDDAPARPADVPPRLGAAVVKVVRNPECLGAARSRNRALRVLGDHIDVVGFLDDDVRIGEGWFDTALEELLPSRGAVTGPVYRFDDGLVARARQLRYDSRYSALEPGQRVEFLAGGNSVVWRQALVETGGFPETATMSDTLLAQRLAERGAGCHFVPRLAVAHRNSKGLQMAVAEAWRAGRIDGARRRTRYVRRLARGLVAAPHSVDPPAALLNVALDAVFLMGHASVRAVTRASQPEHIPAPTQTLDPARRR